MNLMRSIKRLFCALVLVGLLLAASHVWADGSGLVCVPDLEDGSGLVCIVVGE